ncbi:hypothetical protein [Azonexus sp.]|jgi:hypothetical protein|uniref:phage tail fiber protein n=1 Tax=Azonexus sp. TaxID=1872668 RepID=UPI002830CD3B|nr:hypothetical protein [Azonexus sp.]MDR1995146.1 hypothetical protein [Azonexus sp.]
MQKLKLLLLWATICLSIVFGGFVSTPAKAEALTDHAENKILDAMLRGQPLGAPATFYIGLATDTCTDAGAGLEPSGNGYARVAVASTLANWAGTQGAGSTAVSSGTSGLTSNNNVIAFNETTGAWGKLMSVLWYDASGGGNAWICINLTSPLDVTGAGFTIRFNPGLLQFQIDN